jgi:hypothetical protein
MSNAAKDDPAKRESNNAKPKSMITYLWFQFFL